MTRTSYQVHTSSYLYIVVRLCAGGWRTRSQRSFHETYDTCRSERSRHSSFDGKLHIGPQKLASGIVVSHKRWSSLERCGGIILSYVSSTLVAFGGHQFLIHGPLPRCRRHSALRTPSPRSTIKLAASASRELCNIGTWSWDWATSRCDFDFSALHSYSLVPAHIWHHQVQQSVRAICFQFSSLRHAARSSSRKGGRTSPVQTE